MSSESTPMQVKDAGTIISAVTLITIYHIAMQSRKLRYTCSYLNLNLQLQNHNYGAIEYMLFAR